MHEDARPGRREKSPRARVILASLVGAGALAAGLSASVLYASRLVAAHRGSLFVPATRRAVAGVPPRFADIRDGRRDTIELRVGARPVLLLIYSSLCNVCADNMPRWLDLVEELRRTDSPADVIAIDLDGRDSLGAFWPPMRGVRQLSAVDRDAFVRWADVPGTPSSVVVRDGSVDAVVVGIVGPRRRHYLLSRLRT